MLANPMKHNSLRRGAVAVEFAVIAPLLLLITMGMVEINRVFESQNLLESAAREGARLAGMDRDGMLGEGQTTNDKVISDVKNFLASNGIDRDDVTVAITYPESTTEFDLDDPDLALEMFELSIQVDYSAVSYTSVSPGSDYGLTASVVFRNGVSTMFQ